MAKKFLTDIVGYDFLGWKNNKIIIKAPTGTGKSNFTIGVLLKHYRIRGLKLLILCNRRLLRMQYWYQLAQKFNTYEELEESVDILSYQELAVALMNGSSAEDLLRGYAGIVLDEVHYFYADSDFNPFGTYVLLQALIKAGLEKQMIFLTATMDCIEPWIRKIINHYAMSLPMNEKWEDLEKNCLTIKKYDIEIPDRYAHVTCLAVQDMESLAEIFSKSTKKGIIFMDNIKKAEEISALLQKCGLKRSEISCLNADNLEKTDNMAIVKALALANRVETKIILTTSVLDNGVSIHDEDVENVAIITESKVSFLQMLGRIRVESTKNLNLYFLVRNAEEFGKREQELKEILDSFDKSDRWLYQNRLSILNTIWNNSSEMTDIYRKVYVIEPEKIDVLQKSAAVYISYGDTEIAVNLFAKAKIGDLYLTEAKFHQMALVNPLRVIYEQMSWIDKKPEELQVLNSTYLETLESDLKNRLLGVQEYTHDQLKKLKEELAIDYGKNLLKDYALRKRSFSTEIFRKILGEYDMRLIESTVEQKKYYSVRNVDIVEEVPE